MIDDEFKENDLLLVIKIDRSSRNTLEFLKLQERLYKKGVRFISLDLPYSTDMSVNQLISTNLVPLLLLRMNVEKSDSGKESKLLRKMENILAKKL